MAKISWEWRRQVPFDRDAIHEYILENYVAHSRRLDLLDNHYGILIIDYVFDPIK